MSSEAWTESPARPRGSDGDQGNRAAGSPDALQPWQLFTLAGLIGATIVVFVSPPHSVAGIVLLSLTVFAAAVAGAASWRALAPLVMREDVGNAQVLGGRTRAALEREKTLVLRSIKELEFDRAMGKVAEKDFNEMTARLRVRAARLIRQLDARSTYREQIVREIDQRIGTEAAGLDPRRAGSAVMSARPSGTGMVSSAATVNVGPAVSPPPLKCPHCGTDNESDARFCKHCGASLEPTE